MNTDELNNATAFGAAHGATAILPPALKHWAGEAGLRWPAPAPSRRAAEAKRLARTDSSMRERDSQAFHSYVIAADLHDRRNKYPHTHSSTGFCTGFSRAASQGACMRAKQLCLCAVPWEGRCEKEIPVGQGPSVHFRPLRVGERQCPKTGGTGRQRIVVSGPRPQDIVSSTPDRQKILCSTGLRVYTCGTAHATVQRAGDG